MEEVVVSTILFLTIALFYGVGFWSGWMKRKHWVEDRRQKGGA